jgi:Fe-S oxidoreductase
MEEKHSTRGRAHLLFETMLGETIQDGWKSEAMFDALDLCLSCKGCKGDCPVNVDMATYKAEFLSHYYEGKMRPRHAYAMGLIPWWARAASVAPEVANFFSQTPGLRDVARAAGGLTQHRPMPKFARQTFQSWFARRPKKNSGAPAVILWPDTFSNYFHPAVAAAAVEVLETAGFEVKVPKAKLCCGRPLYDYGMLDLAKAQLKNILTKLQPAIAAGTPVVGLEPSCVTVFRDEMPDLLPNDEDAKRLKQQTFTLAEFLVKHAPNFHPPRLERKALVHGHCHQKAVLGMDEEEKLVHDMGLDATVLDEGCCGMAGSFGFEEEKYDISMRVGELGVLPKVRAASKDMLVVADGFSCRTQVEQSTDRQALHVAQVMQMALRRGIQGTPGEYPEREWTRLERNDGYLREMATAGALAVAGGALLYKALRRNDR